MKKIDYRMSFADWLTIFISLVFLFCNTSYAEDQKNNDFDRLNIDSKKQKIEASKESPIDKLISATLEKEEISESSYEEIKKLGLVDELALGIIKSIRARLVSNPVADSLSLKELAIKSLNENDNSLKKIRRLFATAEEVDRLVIKQDRLALLVMHKSPLPKDEINIIEAGILRIVLSEFGKMVEKKDDNAVLSNLRFLADIPNKELPKPLLIYVREAFSKFTDAIFSGSMKDSELDDTFNLICSLKFDNILKQLEYSVGLKTADVIPVLNIGVSRSLSRGFLEPAEFCFNSLISRRKDPNKENTIFRKKIILRADTPVSIDFANRRIEELRNTNQFDLIFRLRLLMCGWYYKWSVIFVGAFINVLIWFLFVVYAQPANAEEDLEKEPDDDEIDRIAKELGEDRNKVVERLSKSRKAKLLALRKENKKFFNKLGRAMGRSGPKINTRVSETRGQVERKEAWGSKHKVGANKTTTEGGRIFGLNRANSTDDEYSKLLKVLGLEDSATEKDIDGRYAMVAQKFDIGKLISSSNMPAEERISSEDMDTITSAYQRVKEIRSRMFNVKGVKLKSTE